MGRKNRTIKDIRLCNENINKNIEIFKRQEYEEGLWIDKTGVSDPDFDLHFRRWNNAKIQIKQLRLRKEGMGTVLETYSVPFPFNNFK